MTGWVDILKFEIANLQANAYTTNTTFINECIINDGLHIHDYIHLLPASILNADNINISCAELFDLDGNTSNTQTQINARVSIATLSSTLTSYDIVTSVNTKIEGTKPWVSGRSFVAGSISNNVGAQNALTAGNINNSSASTYVFTIPTHSNGGNYNIFITPSPLGGGAFVFCSNV